MNEIKVNTKCKQYKKEDKTTQKAINALLERLLMKINAEGKDVNGIYNNDSIIYDRINKSFFLYKAHGANNTQLRIVYAFERKGENSILYLIDYVVKKKNDKQYIADMNNKFRTSELTDMAFSNIACAI